MPKDRTPLAGLLTLVFRRLGRRLLAAHLGGIKRSRNALGEIFAVIDGGS